MFLPLSCVSLAWLGLSSDLLLLCCCCWQLIHGVKNKKQELDKTLEEAAYVAEKEALARALLSTMKRNFEVFKLEAEF